MNKQPKVTRKEQRSFIRDEAIRLLHFAVRNCPCDGVSCQRCHGTKQYYDDPVPIFGGLTNGMNSSKKDDKTPTSKISSYTLLVDPKYRVSKGDRVTPFGMREFEQVDEIISVDDSTLTYIPVSPREVDISFLAHDGVLRFRPIRDFSIAREYYGRIPLYSKTIKWITSPPNDQQKFSARYNYYPDFEIDEIPESRLSQSQRLIQELKLKKITIAGQKKTESYEQSSAALQGLKYE